MKLPLSLKSIPSHPGVSSTLDFSLPRPRHGAMGQEGLASRHRPQ